MKPLKSRLTKKGSRQRKTVLVMPVKPADEAAAHQARVRDHLGKLRSINAAYSDSMLAIYRDGELRDAAKKSLISKNMRQVAAALAAWHSESLDIVSAGNKLRSNLADQHAELQRTLANFGSCWTN